jgi:hypothetical protein
MAKLSITHRYSVCEKTIIGKKAVITVKKHLRRIPCCANIFWRENSRIAFVRVRCRIPGLPDAQCGRKKPNGGKLNERNFYEAAA